MTTDKYTPIESKLENMLKGIDSRIHEIKGIVLGMYAQLSELVDTADAVYRTVSYHTNPHDPAYTPDGDWDFLDEEE